MSRFKQNIILLLLVVLLVALPLFLIKDSEFSGADVQAEDTISEIQPHYEPWFTSFWQPPGGETESLLFSMQAAIGSGVIFYCIGYLKGKSKRTQAKSL